MNAVQVLTADSPFQVTANGLVVIGDPIFDEWVAAGKALKSVLNAVQFAIGDWLNYGHARYGERCAQVLETYEMQTLVNFAYVARNVPPEVRCPSLPYSHHAEVAALPREEQAEVLRLAAEHEWTVRDVRAEVRRRTNKPLDGNALVRVLLTRDQVSYIIACLEAVDSFEAREIIEALKEVLE